LDPSDSIADALMTGTSNVPRGFEDASWPYDWTPLSGHPGRFPRESRVL